MFWDESLDCRDIWVYLWTSEYQGILMTQVVEADHSKILLVGWGWHGTTLMTLAIVCSCSLHRVENKSMYLIIHTHCLRIFKASWGYVNAQNKTLWNILPDPLCRTRNGSSEATCLISSGPWIQSVLNASGFGLSTAESRIPIGKTMQNFQVGAQLEAVHILVHPRMNT